MNLNFGKDDMGNEVLVNKEGFLFNLFTMIENGFFEGKMNKRVMNIIRKTDEELLTMGFDSDDINKLRIKTSEENLEKEGFNISQICEFNLQNNRREFVVEIMNIIENNETSKKVDYILSIKPYQRIKLGFKMSDLDLINGSIKRANKFKSITLDNIHFINRLYGKSLSYNEVKSICKNNGTRIPKKSEIQKLYDDKNFNIELLEINSDETSIWCIDDSGDLYIAGFKNKCFCKTVKENKLYLIEVIKSTEN